MKKPYLLTALILTLVLLLTQCAREDEAYTSVDDLKNARIGVMTGSTGERLALTGFQKADIKSFDDVMDAISSLSAGQIGAVITAHPTAVNVVKHNKDLMIIPEPLNSEDISVAVQKGNKELLGEVDRIIERYKADGTLKELKRRWMKTDPSPYETVQIELPEKGEPLRVGTSATREPFCFVDENRDITGHDGELARRIAFELKRPIKFSNMNFAALIPALQSGKIDMIVAGMSPTEERAKSVDFSIPYYQDAQVALVRNSHKTVPQNSVEAPARTIDDFKKGRIGVLLGSTHDTYALKNFPDAEILQFNSPPEIILAVKKGKVDSALLCTENLHEILRHNDGLEIIGDVLFSDPVGMAFNKENDELREQFNDFLEKIKREGIHDQIIKNWVINGSSRMPDIEAPVTNGVIKVGVSGAKGLPFSATVNNRIVGLDIEFVERFAAYSQKKLILDDMEFGSLITAVASNKIDMAASTLMITEERKKQIDFSNPYLHIGASLFTLKDGPAVNSDKKIKSIEDIADSTVGVYTGTIHDSFVAENYPQASIKRFNMPADIILALKTEKIDIALIDLYSARVLIKDNPDIIIFNEDLLSLPVACAFNYNNPGLRQEFNDFLREIRDDGTYDKMFKRWFIDDPEKAQMPSFSFDNNSPKIILAVAVGDLPNSAVVNGEHVGFDIEIIKTFAHRKGYNLKINTMEFGSLVAALASGKADIIADGIAITEERRKHVAFSDSYNMFKTAVLVLKKNLALTNASEQANFQAAAPRKKSILKNIADSFYSNIILENRYLLILEGLKNTAIISILSTLLGTILGGLICFMRMSKSIFLQIPSKIYISILRGTPVLVILMIIFYVVFASVDIDPVLVAVIAFGLNFAAYVSEMFRTGIEGVDRGQTEAGIAIGFSRVKTFIHIVLPQAVRRILPVYKGEMISLVKMTSIVGYIAVHDLTKASDIIRSRTFDAFFPLIMVAVLYFLISWLLMYSLGYIEMKINPKMSRNI